MAQPYANFQNNPEPPPYIVVNQQPPQQPQQQSQFPISFSIRIVFVFAILKCIIGFMEFVVGIVNIFAVGYFTSVVAFPIWCGLTVS